MTAPDPTPHRRDPVARAPSGGQALVETAVTLPVLLALFFGFLCAGVGAQGYVDLNTAVYLAAASNVTAFADDQPDADRFATDTFDHTIAHDTLLERQAFSCGGDYTAGGTVTCQGSAVLRFSWTPLSVAIPFDPTVTARASAVRSRYRSVPP